MIKTEVRDVTKRTPVRVGADCDNCGLDIGKESGKLEITLISGYGEYFDANGDAHLILCRACGDRLCAAFPCFKLAMAREQRG